MDKQVSIRKPFIITLANGETKTYYCYSYAQAKGYAVQLSLRRYLNINKIQVKEK